MTTAAIRVSERAQPSTTFDAVIPFVGRVLLSAIFLFSVVGKIQEPAGTIGYIASAGLPLPQLGYALAVLIELVGGLALLVGYRTRIAAGAWRSSRSRPRSASTTTWRTWTSSSTSSRTSRSAAACCRSLRSGPVRSVSTRISGAADRATRALRLSPKSTSRSSTFLRLALLWGWLVVGPLFCNNVACTMRSKVIMLSPGKVPKALAEKFATITALTDDFWAQHLNDEYRRVIQRLVGTLARKRPSPLLKGKESIWAAAVVHAIGRINFLDDPAQTPHCKPTVIFDFFGVVESTGQTKSREIQKLLDMGPLSPEWTLPSRLADNPMVWMLEVDGLMMDIRHAPVKLQRAAFEQGLIPLVPAEQSDKSR